MIHINQLQKSYGKVKAVNGIDLRVEAGELFAFLGPNGAGKTTTIRILTGLTRIGYGEVRIGGHDIIKAPREAKRQCGLVPQHINLDSELSVRENLEIHGRLFGMDSGQRRRKIEELLAYVELLDRIDTLVKQLSGGLKRRLMIARALMHEPKVLFLDEATSSVDTRTEELIQKAMDALTVGRTSFVIAHRLSTIRDADMILVMNGGDIVERGTHEELLAKGGFYADIYNSQFTLAE